MREHQCSQTVFGERVQHWNCQRAGVVQRNGKWYCRQYDSKAVAARRKAKDAEYRAERDAEQRILDEGERLAALLGCGCCGWGKDISTLVITFAEAEQLIARLQLSRTKANDASRTS